MRLPPCRSSEGSVISVVCPARALAVITLWLCLALPAGVRASEAVNLYAGFSPDRPKASTTITFGFTITSPDGQVPSPMQSVNLHLPGGIGLARNTLGTAVCEPIYLYAHGPSGCPPNSRVGYGAVLAEVPYGPIVVREHATVDAYRGNPEHEHITILFFAEGWTPVFADLVFPGQILEDQPPYSGRIDTEVPPVPSLPGGPDVSVVQFQSTFGPQHLTYEREDANGEIKHFKPRGVSVPPVCPRGGFPFAADLAFEDGSHVTAHTAAPCPHSQQRRTRTPRH